MSERKSRKRIIAWILLVTAGSVLILISGLRSVPDGSASYSASGRAPEVSEIRMPAGSVSINEADADELTALRGIGETLAGLIIDERDENGPFRYPEDLTGVKGIGMKKLEGFRDSINLD